MKDMTRPRKTMLNSFREGLIQKHPKVLNVFLIFALISLVVAGAFLLSDIMSFKSNAAQKEHFSGLHQKISKESQIMIKNWQEKGTELMDQGKSGLGLKGTDNTTATNATDNDEVGDLLARNRLAKALEARTMGGNLSHLQNPSPSNSSLTQTAVQPVQSISPTLIGSSESEDGSGSDTPVYNFGDGSSKEIEGSQRVDSVASNLSQNQPISNETVLNESIMNEPVLDKLVMNESFMNESKTNKSQINQSQENLNSSSNISESLPITDLGSNGTRNSSYSFVPRNTNHSFDNLSSGSPAFPRPQMNPAALNSTEIHEGLAPDKNDSAVSAPKEFNNKNNEIAYDQKNVTSDALESRRDDISSNSVPDKSSNITSRQINISLEGHTNFVPRRETISANNSSSQIQEPRQNQTSNRTESERNSGISSLSLSPKLNNEMEGTQNHVAVTSSSGSARSQESKKSQTNNVNRFKSLKMPTPSWTAKAESMKKMKKIK